MTDTAALFPGFTARRIDGPAGPAGPVFVRSAGDGPPVVLLHGFPQTHAMWHGLAPALARTHRVVCLDLRGYGGSAAPRGDGGRQTYTKRAMAGDVVAVMAGLGHHRFSVVGHDRGARVGYRLALDRPDAVERLALLDITPTVAMWRGMNAARALQIYHWLFLAQPEPMPERLLAADPAGWLDHTIASWTAARSLDAFDPRALAAYRAAFAEPARRHAACEDYRAGAATDLAHDEADLAAGRRIACPVQVLWGESGIPARGESPLSVWRESFAPQAEGQAIASGHFLAEENPAATLAALEPFLAKAVA